MHSEALVKLSRNLSYEFVNQTCTMCKSLVVVSRRLICVLDLPGNLRPHEYILVLDKRKRKSANKVAKCVDVQLFLIRE